MTGIAERALDCAIHAAEGSALTKPEPPPCPFEDGRHHRVTWRAAAFGDGYGIAEYLDCQTCPRVILVWHGVLETAIGRAVPEAFQPAALRQRVRWRDRRSAARRRKFPEPVSLCVDLRPGVPGRPA